MKFEKNSTIKSRLMLMQISMLAALAAVIGGISYITMAAYFERLNESELNANAKIISGLMHHYMHEQGELLEKIVKSDATEKYYKSFDTPALNAYLMQFDERYPLMTFLNFEGNEELRFIGRNMSTEKVSQDALMHHDRILIMPNQFYYSNPYQSRILDVPVLKIGYLHYNYFGEKVGPVFADIKLENFDSVLKKKQLEFNGKIIISNENGTIIYSNNPQWYTKKITELTEKDSFEGLLQKPGEVSAFTLSSLETMAASVKVAELPWHVSVFVPASVFNAPLGNLRIYVISASLVLIALGLFLSYLIGQSIIAPINRLGRVIDNISETGDLTKHVSWRGDDELGRVAKSFNRMIDKLKLLTDHINKERKFSSGIIHAMGDSLIVVDTNGLVKDINAAARKLLSYEIHEGKGVTITTIVPDYPVIHGKVQTEATSYIVEDSTYVTSTGKIIPVILTLSKMDNGDTVLVAKDNTERARIEAMKNEFISTVSHELRTPLTSISGALKLIDAGMAGPLPEEMQNLLAIANSNASRLLVIVNDILDLHKIESGELSFNFQPLEIYPLLEQAMHENSFCTNDKGIQLELANDPAKSLIINADEFRLIQVMNNLLSNAVKYSPEGGKVLLAVQQNEAVVRVSVHDQGLGIPESFHDKVFDRFSQADSSDARVNSGTGLGLNIARMIIEKHQGVIGFLPNESEGTTFYFDLPIVRK